MQDDTNQSVLFYILYRGKVFSTWISPNCVLSSYDIKKLLFVNQGTSDIFITKRTFHSYMKTNI
jgi:hypothetical protein